MIVNPRGGHAEACPPLAFFIGVSIEIYLCPILGE